MHRVVVDQERVPQTVRKLALDISHQRTHEGAPERVIHEIDDPLQGGKDGCRVADANLDRCPARVAQRDHGGVAARDVRESGGNLDPDQLPEWEFRCHDQRPSLPATKIHECVPIVVG